MCESYIALGLDPARFWDVTPRLMVLEVKGAERRHEIARSMVWMGAMLPHFKKPMRHDDYVRPRRRAQRQTPDELQAMCDALAAAWGAKQQDPA